MATALILPIWYAAICIRFVAAYRMHGRIRRFVLPWLYLLLSACRSLPLVWFQYRHDVPAAVAYSSHSIPVLLLAEALAIAGAFWAVTEKYPKFRLPGSIFLGILALVGTTAAYLSRFVAVPAGWAGLWQSAALLQRSVLTGMIVTLILVRMLLPRIWGVPIRPSADRVSNLMICEVGVELFATTFAVATGHVYKVVDALIPVCGSLVVSSLWAFWLPKASNECGEALKLPPGLADALCDLFEKEEQRLRAGMRELLEWLWE